jgi:hypothetical protein
VYYTNSINKKGTPNGPYGEISEIVVRSGRWDSKDREIGYVVGFRDNGADFRAYVQNARRVNGEWNEFERAQQPSKSFKSQEAATRWAYQTANERITKL